MHFLVFIEMSLKIKSSFSSSMALKFSSLALNFQ
jgi:hypothetical protein